MLQDTSQAIADPKVQLRLIDDQLHRVEPRYSCQVSENLQPSLLFPCETQVCLGGCAFCIGKTINSRNLDQSRKRQQRGIVCNARSITRHLRLVRPFPSPIKIRSRTSSGRRRNEERTKDVITHLAKCILGQGGGGGFYMNFICDVCTCRGVPAYAYIARKRRGYV